MVEELDIALLRDLLSLLQEHKVKSFSMDGITLSFKDDEPALPVYQPKQLSKINDETQPVRASAPGAPVDGSFKDPRLWSGGRPITFSE